MFLYLTVLMVCLYNIGYPCVGSAHDSFIYLVAVVVNVMLMKAVGSSLCTDFRCLPKCSAQTGVKLTALSSCALQKDMKKKKRMLL